MDSPRTEKSQTRFSTPVSDLDDHRNQPSSIQPIDNAESLRLDVPSRNDTSQNPNASRLEWLQVDHVSSEAKPVPRDFEHAIIDDDSQCDAGGEENQMLNSVALKRGLTRRSYNRQEKVGRSRESSTSTRSTSPQNSVDAFADPRRRERANTIGSKGPSDVELGLHRTVSSGTHRRRPTISGGSNLPIEANEQTAAAEEDVCFPQFEEPSKTSKIDFEVLEEFVAESSRGRAPTSARTRQKLSFSSHGHKPKIFDDLRIDGHAQSGQEVPGPLNDHFESTVNDSESVVDEKCSGSLSPKPPLERRPSLGEGNRYSFFSSELEHTIHAAELGDLTMPGVTFRDLFELPPEGGVWWLDLLNPHEEELNTFQKAFGIHRLTTEDIMTQEAREKVELFKQYYFVCFRSFYQMDKTSEDYMEPVNVYMVVFREGILTFTYTQSPHSANVRKRIGKLRDYMNLTADWICYAMVDNIVDTFGPVITSIEIETDVIEDQVFVARTEDFSSLLRQIGECRRKVMSLMRLLGGKADVIKGFAKRCNEQYSVTPRGEIGLYLGDIQDHVVTMMSNLGHSEKMLSRSHSNYLAQLSVDQIAQGNRANEVLSKITMIATVLVPLNLICGLFGMNVPVPGHTTDGLEWFFGIVGVIAAIVVGSFILARKYRFI